MLSYRADLQVLRGFAVVLVFFYHLKIVGFDNGYLGVDLFFVLSGYLMAMLSEKATVLEFYSRRLRRLLPAYFVTILLTTLTVVLIAVPVDSDQRLDRFWFDLIGLSNIAFWLEYSYFDWAAFKPLLNLWSLGVELQFYLIAPFLLPFLRGRLAVALSLLLGSLIVSLVLLTISPKTSFFMMPTRLWEFLIGAFVAWYPIGIVSIFKKKIISYLSLATLLGVLFFYPLKDDSLSVFLGHPGIASVIVVISTGLLISLSLDSVFNLSGFLGKVFSKLGDYSYSIYLTHFPIIVLVNYAAFGGTNLGSNSLLNTSIIVLTTGLLSYLMFNYVEILRFKNNLKLPIFVTAFALVLVGILGPQVATIKYTNKQNSIFFAWKDRSEYRCGKISRIINPTETMCNIGSIVSDERVLLLGNSHADSIKVSFANAMDDNLMSTYFYVANTTLLTENTNAKVIAKDVKRLKIDNVVIHYSHGFYSNEFNKRQLAEFLTLMANQRIKVLIIAPVPVYDFHVPKEMYHQTIEPNIILNRQTAEDYLTETANIFEFIERLGVINSNIFLSHKYLCKDDLCLLDIDGQPAYFDGAHLTLKGAKLLTPLFNDVARQIKNN